MQEISQNQEQLLTFLLAEQMFGVPVLQVNDVLGPQKITRTPLAPPSVSGVMNLRGKIVTAIDVRRCLHQPPRAKDKASMSVVVNQNNELFSLMIDSVGDVLSLSGETYEKVPETLNPSWRSVASGIHKLEDKILVVLNVAQLLQLARQESSNGMSHS